MATPPSPSPTPSPTPAPGAAASNPAFVTIVSPTPAPGHTAVPDPAVVAAQKSAQYTLALTWVTGLLFIGTLLALAIGEVQRRLGVVQADAARTAQYNADRALQDRELTETRRQRREDADEVIRRETEAQQSALAQLLAILQSYERAVNILLMGPQYPILSRTRTMEALFHRVFSDSIAGAIPQDIRDRILRAVIKAQETLQVATENQALHDSMFEQHERDGQIMTLFAARATAADNDHKALGVLVEAEDDVRHKAFLEAQLRSARHRLEDVKSSPDAYTSAHFIATEKANKTKFDALYRIITTNAKDAKQALVEARAMLGDDSVTDFIPEDRLA